MVSWFGPGAVVCWPMFYATGVMAISASRSLKGYRVLESYSHHSAGGEPGHCLTAHTRLGFLPGCMWSGLNAAERVRLAPTPSPFQKESQVPSCEDRGTIVPRENLLESNAGSPGRKGTHCLVTVFSLVGVAQTWESRLSESGRPPGPRALRTVP